MSETNTKIYTEINWNGEDIQVEVFARVFREVSKDERGRYMYPTGPYVDNISVENLTKPINYRFEDLDESDQTYIIEELVSAWESRD